MGKKRGHAATRAIDAVERAGAPYVLHEYEHSAQARSFGEETVARLGVEASRAFKTLMVRCDTGEFVVAVVPVSHHLSLKKIAAAAGARSAQMAEPAVVQRRTGYVVGGISPLGQTTRHRVFIDASALDEETILVSGGKRGLSLELAGGDLVELTGGEVVDLCALD